MFYYVTSSNREESNTIIVLENVSFFKSDVNVFDLDHSGVPPV